MTLDTVTTIDTLINVVIFGAIVTLALALLAGIVYGSLQIVSRLAKRARRLPVHAPIDTTPIVIPRPITDEVAG